MTSAGSADAGTSAHESSLLFFMYGEGCILEVMNDFVSLISNVGFPIFACIMMYKAMDKEREDHKDESAKWIEALNNNTNVMQKLVDKLEEK